MRKFFFLFFLTAAGLHAQSSPFQVRISIFKQNFTANEPLRVNVSLFNAGMQEQSFALSDALFQSLSFDLRTAANEELALKPEMDARSRTVYANPGLYRRITLAPGEAFSLSYDLRTYFNLSASGSYYIRARFFPDPDNRAESFESEYTAFTQAPPELIRALLVQKNESRTRSLGEAQKMLPGEAVQDLFEAQMNKDWERFLIHIDPERLINAFTQYANQYNASLDGTLRLDLIEQFKRFLTVHWNLPLRGYEIRETVIRKDTATVEAEAYESIRMTTRRIRYSFSLYRNGQGQWLIDNYTVLAMN